MNHVYIYIHTKLYTHIHISMHIHTHIYRYLFKRVFFCTCQFCCLSLSPPSLPSPPRDFDPSVSPLCETFLFFPMSCICVRLSAWLCMSVHMHTQSMFVHPHTHLHTNTHTHARNIHLAYLRGGPINSVAEWCCVCRCVLQCAAECVALRAISCPRISVVASNE